MTAQELTKVVGRHADTLEDLRKDVAHLEIVCNNYRLRIEDLEVEVKMLRSDVDRCYVTRKRSRMKEGE